VPGQLTLRRAHLYVWAGMLAAARDARKQRPGPLPSHRLGATIGIEAAAAAEGSNAMAKYSGGKTKVFFSFGIYLWFWTYSLFCNLRDDFGNEVPSYWWMLVPIYNWVVWWRFLTTIQRTQQRIGMGQTLSVGRAFFLSPFWFSSVPYVNRHVNALYTFRAGGQAGLNAAEQLGMMRPSAAQSLATPNQAAQIPPQTSEA